MRIGLDFGTTNSGAALFDGQHVHLLPLEPGTDAPGVIRSAMYVTREQEFHFGQLAFETYYSQNTGRPSRLIRQYVGEIETAFAEVGAVKGYPAGLPEVVREVYVLVDELMPGRLLTSLKSELGSSYAGTSIFGRSYTLEELIARFLEEMRHRAEAHTGERVEGAVMGRPVHFSGALDQTGDALAERRLRQAADLAGLGEVSFELEPVAAARYFELQAPHPQNVLVFDMGGGTLDLTVMRLGGPGERLVYATGGMDQAGDTFDQRIIAGVLLEHFGRGSTWGTEGSPFPDRYTDALVHWQSIPELNRPETLNFLQLAQLSSDHPARVRAFESLLVNNDVARLVQQVEHAKIALSHAPFALIQLVSEDYDIWQPLTRSQFEQLIADVAQQVETCILDTLSRSGLRAEDIGTVVRTGGSAQIPHFVGLLQRIFGPDKVIASDTFSSVSAGLAISAWGGG